MTNKNGLEFGCCCCSWPIILCSTTPHAREQSQIEIEMLSQKAFEKYCLPFCAFVSHFSLCLLFCYVFVFEIITYCLLAILWDPVDALIVSSSMDRIYGWRTWLVSQKRIVSKRFGVRTSNPYERYHRKHLKTIKIKTCEYVWEEVEKTNHFKNRWFYRKNYANEKKKIQQSSDADDESDYADWMNACTCSAEQFVKNSYVMHMVSYGSIAWPSERKKHMYHNFNVFFGMAIKFQLVRQMAV